METKMMDNAVYGLESKSDKIRKLHDAGFETADIARYLGIRYQFAYNVIAKHAGSVNAATVAEATEEPALGLTINEAKRGLSLRFGVPVDAIEIIIRG